MPNQMSPHSKRVTIRPNSKDLAVLRTAAAKMGVSTGAFLRDALHRAAQEIHTTQSYKLSIKPTPKGEKLVDDYFIFVGDKADFEVVSKFAKTTGVETSVFLRDQIREIVAEIIKTKGYRFRRQLV